MKRANSFAILVQLYVFLIGVWAAVWWFAGDATWWLTLLNRFVPYLFLPVPLMLLPIWRTRQYKLVTWLLLPSFIFGLLYYPYFWPKLTPAAQTADLTVMTYNVLFSNGRYDAVAELILTQQPDLIALQEVQPEMMTALQARLAAEYPFSQMGTENPYGTTAVFSRTPITNSYILDLQADRPAVVVHTEVNGQPVTFAAVHLLAYGLQWVPLAEIPAAVMERTTTQNQQARLLLEALEDEPGIVIIGCDCNSKETSSSYRILVEQMQNTSRVVGWWGNGRNHDQNLQHIDYLFFRGWLTPLKIQALPNSGCSDHAPIVGWYGFE